MNVLVVGSGGREHALVHALSSSPSVSKVYCAPGNAGIAEQAECIPIEAGDVKGLLAFAEKSNADLTVVGPEQPLVDGIVDVFRERGMAIFGPTSGAARLEGSKVFSKEFMDRYGIPTAGFASFHTGEEQQAVSFASSLTPPLVVKASGLAAGKGVLICADHAEAELHIRSMLAGESFGTAGSSIVIEEYLEGEEASIFVLTDGSSYVLLPPAQDHKRVFDNDEGMNTGGMGAYAPAPVITPGLLAQIESRIIRPTLDGMTKEGHPYTGCLYVGLMITKSGPSVLEYNCRFGDPETQVVVPLIESDAGELFMSIARGTLDGSLLRLRDNSAVCVVLASGGYPGPYEKGKKISGLETIAGADDVIVFHAGTSRTQGEVVTSGGRVLGITTLGPADDLSATIRKAYGAVTHVSFESMHYRKDIGAGARRGQLQ